MSEISAQERALALFEIDDIFVVELKCRVVRDFNQTALFSEQRYQHRFQPQNEAISQQRNSVDGKEQMLVFRYFLDAGVQLIKPDVPADRAEFTDADVLAEIHGVIAIDYRASKDPREDPEAISAFGPNVVFHAWPYWRALVIDRAAQMRLPRIVLPMLRQASKKPIQLEPQGAELS